MTEHKEGNPAIIFEEEVKALLAVPLEEGKETVIKNPALVRLANLALQPRNRGSERLQDLLKRGDDWYAEGQVPEEEWSILAGVIEGEKSRLGKQIVPDSSSSAGKDIDQVAAAMLKLEERLALGQEVDAGILESQKQQLEMWAGGGYDGFISAENAQVRLSPEIFETQPQAWYRELNDKWQTIIRHRIYVMLGCFPKRARGHVDLEVMAENPDVRIDRDALALMWDEMPGFRIAVATITNDFFEIKEEIPVGLADSPENKVKLMVLTEKAKKKKIKKEEGGYLEDFAVYKKELIKNLETYFTANPGLLKEEKGTPKLSPQNAARAAVAAAWNWFFVGNAIDSADQGNLTSIAVSEIMRISEPTPAQLKENPTVGRKVKNTIVYAEQARAMMLPYDKAWGKVVKVEGEEMKVGTEETWLKDLGDYVAERTRHSEQFKKEFFHRARRIIPQRLFASWFDLTTFEKGEDGVETSVADKLCNEQKKDLGVGNLCDFTNPKNVDFSQLESSELWGGYADAWDSAKKIYDMLRGKMPLKGNITEEAIGEWRQTFSNALAKLRGTPLAPYYKDHMLIVSCIAGSVGLTEFTNDYLLELPENSYDSLITKILNDDRFFTDMPGARKSLFKILNANNLYSLGGYLGTFAPLNRFQIRHSAALEAKQKQAK